MFLAVFWSFLVFSIVRTPVPAPNEPHYLVKAKHFHDAEWCRGDLFLESSEAHVVFYRTFGVLTRWLTFEETAWAGRVVVLLLLASGWCRLISRLVSGRWACLWSAWAFLALQAIGNFSGEWLVGGVEAKVVSYAFVFWSLALWLDRLWNRAALCGGLAIAFHPVVGIWGLACVLFSGSVHFASTHFASTGWDAGQTTGRSLAWRHRSFAIAVLVVCSLPGLLPALKLIGSGSPAIVNQADSIQVFYRLKHHLDPMEFKTASYVLYAVFSIFFIWQLLYPWSRHSRQLWQFTLFVTGSILIATAGLVIGLGPRPEAEIPLSALRAKLLKFYPFRLGDLMLPIACAVALVGLLPGERSCAHRSQTLSFAGWRQSISWMVFGSALLFALFRPSLDRNPSRMSPSQRKDWIEACRWIAATIPRDALVLTPVQNSWAFKWYAQRAEYVSYKDCPQDAAGIVEWSRRLTLVRQWEKDNRAAGFSAEALERLRKETGVTHVLLRRPGPHDVPRDVEPIYRNRTYRIDRLRDPVVPDPR